MKRQDFNAKTTYAVMTSQNALEQKTDKCIWCGRELDPHTEIDDCMDCEEQLLENGNIPTFYQIYKNMKEASAFAEALMRDK